MTDTALKRGAAMLVAMPFRPWVTIPDGYIGHGDRLSLARMAIAAGAVTHLAAGMTGFIRVESRLGGGIKVTPRMAGRVRTLTRIGGRIHMGEYTGDRHGC